MSGENTKGVIFNIQKYSTEDGPGIRTTVFFKGCPLACRWCHNPESINPKPQLVWHGNRCIGDGACHDSCSQLALSATKTGIRIDRTQCLGCKSCVNTCPTNSLEMMGWQTTSEEILDDVLKDEPFYRESKGGVTFSGGEPTLQPEFLLDLVKGAKAADLHVALDTCGHGDQGIFERLSPYLDLVLYDLKTLDDWLHRKATGVGTEKIISNLMYLDGLGIPIWIRTPVIPGFTGDLENISKISEFVAILKNVKRYELLAFSNYCASKYQLLGLEFPLNEVGPITLSAMEELQNVAKRYLDNVIISGPFVKEKSPEEPG